MSPYVSIQPGDRAGATPEPCGCYACLSSDERSRYVLCPSCGNKRCPRATHHAHACTDSNDPGQVGSNYGVACEDAACPCRGAASTSFAARVASFKDARQLAAAFGVSVPTVNRWASGVSKPHPTIAEQVLKYIAEPAPFDSSDPRGCGFCVAGVPERCYRHGPQEVREAARLAVDRADLDHLRETAVYPGHPLTLALLIAKEYPSLAAARASTRNEFPDALSDSRIPGAGGNVYVALDLLGYLAEGAISPEEALVYADRAWSRCDGQEKDNPARWREGQEQADRLKPRIGEIAAWARGEQVR